MYHHTVKSCKKQQAIGRPCHTLALQNVYSIVFFCLLKEGERKYKTSNLANFKRILLMNWEAVEKAISIESNILRGEN